MSKENLIKHLRTIKDFPKKGVLFRDITTLLQDGPCLHELSELMYEMYRDKGITKVVGIESRGFIMGGAVAVRLGAGFVPARKPGKLPGEVLQECYHKEYGDDCIQIHTGSINENDVVLIHDDLLATGGTMLAAYNLVQKFNPKRTYINFIIELDDMKGRTELPQGTPVESLLHL